MTEIRESHLYYPAMPPDPVTGLHLVHNAYSHCSRCHLSNCRDHVVHFRGNPYSPIVAVGEGPGRTEDGDGIPFVGASGRLQTELFREVGINPGKLCPPREEQDKVEEMRRCGIYLDFESDVGWLNLVACRACDNRFRPDRPPTLAEKMACSERFLALLRALRPRIVLLLGDHAASAFIDTKTSHPNTWHMMGDGVDWVCFGYTRHPAYLLRAIPQANSYKEYAAAKLFLEALKVWMGTGQLSNVSSWTIPPRYLVDPQPAIGGCL